MITLIAFFTALFLGLPIFLTLLLGTLVFLLESDLSVLFSSLPIQLYGALNQNGLLAIPLFMLVGELMNKGGLTSRLMNAADVFVGGFRGGLAGAYAELRGYLVEQVGLADLGGQLEQIGFRRADILGLQALHDFAFQVRRRGAGLTVGASTYSRATVMRLATRTTSATGS